MHKVKLSFVTLMGLLLVFGLVTSVMAGEQEEKAEVSVFEKIEKEDVKEASSEKLDQAEGALITWSPWDHVSSPVDDWTINTLKKLQGMDIIEDKRSEDKTI